ncbi:MAG TPA: ATP-binding protein, partial [Caulobacteraceae bacterium]|nr:ATP-binding protein [Caulobacteraceae bacterium]
ARHSGGAGVGLGLSVARSIARAHGGDVTLSSGEGGGLTALVSLPLEHLPEGGLAFPS